VAAFSATLDELYDADLLLHVIDCSNQAFEAQMAAVERLLEKLNLGHIPVIRVFNKRDLVPPEVVENICASYEGTAVSAFNSKTFGPLIRRMEDEILNTVPMTHGPTDHDIRQQPGAAR
jgi:GTPase